MRKAILWDPSRITPPFRRIWTGTYKYEHMHHLNLHLDTILGVFHRFSFVKLFATHLLGLPFYTTKTLNTEFATLL